MKVVGVQALRRFNNKDAANQPPSKNKNKNRPI
jgi:hypothetical protein